MKNKISLKRRTGGVIVFSLILGIILSVIFSVGVTYLEFFVGFLHFNDYAVEKIYINDEDDLIAISKSYANDNYYLANDIFISDEDADLLNSISLKGNFDGQGHSIIFERNTNPLFEIVDTNAVVENVEIEYMDYYDSNLYFGGVAIYNYGNIKNCNIIFDEVSIGLSYYFGGVTVYNRGNITKTLVSGSIIENEDYMKNYVSAGVATFNNGSISSCYSSLKSNYLTSHDYNYLASQKYILKYGSIFETQEKDGKINNVYALKQNLFDSNEKNSNVTFLDSENIDENFFKIQLGLEENIWNLSGSPELLEKGA